MVRQRYNLLQPFSLSYFIIYHELCFGKRCVSKSNIKILTSKSLKCKPIARNSQLPFYVHHRRSQSYSVCVNICVFALYTYKENVHVNKHVIYSDSLLVTQAFLMSCIIFIINTCTCMLSQFFSNSGQFLTIK